MRYGRAGNPIMGCLTSIVAMLVVAIPALLLYIGFQLRHLLALILGAACLVAWATEGGGLGYLIVGLLLIAFAFGHWLGSFAAIPPLATTRTRPPIPAQLRFRVLQRDGFRCRYCGRGRAEGAILQLDRVVPFSKGGASTEDNLVTACSACNRGKSADPVI
jgi:hypothetical protein